MSSAIAVRPLHITRFGSVKARTPSIDSGPIPWPDLCELLNQWDIRPEKSGPLWSPAEYPVGAKRGLALVLRVHLLSLDLDDGTPPEALADRWQGLEYVLHSTYSHTPSKPKWRVIFPLVEPVSRADWSAFYAAAAANLTDRHADASCKDASRIFYLPACPKERVAERIHRHVNGAWLDPGPLLAEARENERQRLPDAADGHSRTADPELIREFLDRALRAEFAGAPGRNVQGMHLACQLRDHGVTEGEALHVLLHGYLPQVIESNSAGRHDPYTEDEVTRTVRGVYARQPRQPWAEKSASYDPSSEAGAAGGAAPPARTAGAALGDDCPDPAMLVPDGWLLTWGATGRLPVTDPTQADDPKTQRAPTKRVADAPVLITGAAVNLGTRERFLVVAWPGRHRQWLHELAPRAVLRNSRGLQGLAGKGFPYIEIEGKQLANYLGATETLNQDRLPTARLTSKLGWQGPAIERNPFLIGHTLIRADGTEDTAAALDPSRAAEWTEDAIAWHSQHEGEDQLVRSYIRRGTWAGNLAAVAALRPHPVALAWWYLGFAPLLLEIFGCPNFCTEIADRTTTGKTTTLRAVGSIYGNPDERTESSVVQTWDVTRVYTERAAGVCNHLPLLLDDTSKARDPRMIPDLIYAVSSGHGRGRGTIGGLASTQTWRTVMFSTGEQPIASASQAGGMRTRTLSIQEAPFGGQTPEIGRLARRLNDEFCRHFGHAAPRFLCWLLRQRGQWDTWRATYQQWVEWYSDHPPTPEAGRLASYAALGDIAGMMAHQALDLPWEYTAPIRTLWPSMAEHARDASGADRALEHVVSWARSHEREFLGRGAETEFGPSRTTVAGRWLHGDDANLEFYPNVLRMILEQARFSADGILAEWAQKGYLVTDPPHRTIKVRIGGERVRMSVISAAAMDQVLGLAEEQETDHEGVAPPD